MSDAYDFEIPTRAESRAYSESIWGKFKMPDYTKLLGDLFADVPGPDDVIGKSGGRIDTTAVVQLNGPVEVPSEWLRQYGIPIRQDDMPCEGAAAAFYCKQHANGIDAEVRIPRGSDINDQFVRWNIWHEIGHCVDHIHVENGRMVMDRGRNGLKFQTLLRVCQSTIISWTPHPDVEYKTSLPELWAECVACAIMTPHRMDKALLDAILPELLARNLPVRASLPPPEPAKPDMHEVNAAIAFLRGNFIGNDQMQRVTELIPGEEGEFFQLKMIELYKQIAAIPKSYDTQGDAMDALVHLHYFTGGCDWYILEKDILEEQHQAFGWANLGDPSCAELGYITLIEITAAGAELDFHWTPKPLGEVLGRTKPTGRKYNEDGSYFTTE